MNASSRFQHLNVILLFLWVLTLMVPSRQSWAQVEPDAYPPKKIPQQNEHPTDPFLYSPREHHPRSPAYRFSSPGFSVVQVNVDDNGMNIVNDAANEPSIAFDPNDPNKIAIGWRQFDNIGNSFRQAGFAFSIDAGETWTFPGVIEPGVFRSDPVLRSDRNGNFFYNSLTSSSGDYWCNVFKSEDGGANWDLGTFAQGGDKQWMSVDQTDGVGSGNIYAHWTSYYSICQPYNFTRSVDGNLSYEDCSSIPNDPYWGTTFVGPNGDLYICGADWGGFRVAKSSNAKDPTQFVTWDYTSYVSLDGEMSAFAGNQSPNPGGLMGQAIISMDSSGGPGNGYLYLLASVARSSNSDPLDIMFARSTNGGLTWDAPVRVNDDPTTIAYQWFGTMSVAPDGRIDAVWLDTRDNPFSVNSALYYAYSLDQGQTWSQNVKLSESFNPHAGWPQQNKLGDYFDMYSSETSAHLAWAATFNGEQDVYYSVITPDYVGITDPEKNSSLWISHYPNPARGQVTITFHLEQDSFVSLKVFSMNGTEIATLLNRSCSRGMNRAVFDAQGLPGGIYYYRLVTGKHNQTGRMVLAD